MSSSFCSFVFSLCSSASSFTSPSTCIQTVSVSLYCHAHLHLCLILTSLYIRKDLSHPSHAPFTPHLQAEGCRTTRAGPPDWELLVPRCCAERWWGCSTAAFVTAYITDDYINTEYIYYHILLYVLVYLIIGVWLHYYGLLLGQTEMWATTI